MAARLRLPPGVDDGSLAVAHHLQWVEGQGRKEGGGRSWIRGQVWGARGGLRNTSHYRDHTELPDHSTAQRTARTSWYQRQASGLMGSPTVPRMRREVRLQAGGQMMGRH